ncbi:MAG: SDR family oxidoreductase [Bdellovibrionales bacterium]|nr:SDR family oxidoreductase [Bdellovibrionales bacterium]
MDVLIIGANRGIGLEFVKQLKEQGHSIIATCRKVSSQLENLNVDIVPEIDVSLEAGRIALKKKLHNKKFDMVIHNAGILRNESLDHFNTETIMEQLNTNSVAPLATLVLLIDHLKPGAKIGVLSSRMGSISDNTSGGTYGYRMSKAALNAGMKSLSVDLKNKHIYVAILHPGWVKTDMTQHNGMIDTNESVHGLIKIMENLNESNSGKFWHTNGEELNW